ncbi:SWEET sugar transporter [Dillenia turbinata]|uniref:Bidirectional sugar transporter SWEET n=1 Tax=Dillenia turbinata TaxID=194707 RepID=A0AAN8ZDK7_9MAGN
MKVKTTKPKSESFTDKDEDQGSARRKGYEGRSEWSKGKSKFLRERFRATPRPNKMADKIHLAVGVMENLHGVSFRKCSFHATLCCTHSYQEEKHGGVLLCTLHNCTPELPPLYLVWPAHCKLQVGEFSCLYPKWLRHSSGILLHHHIHLSKKELNFLMLSCVPVLLAVCITALVSAFTFHDHHHRKVFVSSVRLVASVAMYGSPLVAVKQVIQTKSVEFMPFYLSFFSFLASSLWMAQGLLSHDLFLAVSVIFQKNETMEEPEKPDVEKHEEMLKHQKLMIDGGDTRNGKIKEKLKIL